LKNLDAHDLHLVKKKQKKKKRVEEQTPSIAGL